MALDMPHNNAHALAREALAIYHHYAWVFETHVGEPYPSDPSYWWRRRDMGPILAKYDLPYDTAQVTKTFLNRERHRDATWATVDSYLKTRTERFYHNRGVKEATEYASDVAMDIWYYLAKSPTIDLAKIIMDGRAIGHLRKLSRYNEEFAQWVTGDSVDDEQSLLDEEYADVNQFRPSWVPIIEKAMIECSTAVRASLREFGAFIAPPGEHVDGSTPDADRSRAAYARRIFLDNFNLVCGYESTAAFAIAVLTEPEYGYVLDAGRGIPNIDERKEALLEILKTIPPPQGAGVLAKYIVQSAVRLGEAPAHLLG
ncbi:MAG: hypothetical protein ACYDHP_09640 [Ferrimicrobium sp.]